AGRAVVQLGGRPRVRRRRQGAGGRERDRRRGLVVGGADAEAEDRDGGGSGARQRGAGRGQRRTAATAARWAGQIRHRPVLAAGRQRRHRRSGRDQVEQRRQVRELLVLRAALVAGLEVHLVGFALLRLQRTQHVD